MSISLNPDTPEGRVLAASPEVEALAAPASATKSATACSPSRAIGRRSGGGAVVQRDFEVFFYYRQHKAALIRVQHEQAEAAAEKIGQRPGNPSLFT